ncbi:hypothetical protein IWW36_000843 [Coemansia brasiliensis]|uniref:Uncharacterized protein n=1 Tax=Coemansia brasiliensis TaxID=2650707 RepID=A0A9W8IEY2_9FUNG|nr:hypothetical protein IWW36_000843 [Coemansia brasiliensis]
MGPASKHRSRSRSPKRSRDASIPQITQDDYYKFNAPFRLWLRKEKERYFDEMSSEKARKYFGSFIRAWNEGRLRSRYYKQEGELKQLSKDVVTRHNWGFASKINPSEQQKINAIRNTAPGTQQDQETGNSSRASGERPSEETVRLRDEEEREERRMRRKQERRRAKEQEELMLDEVAPKETGREAKLAKKRAISRLRHGEKSLDVDIPDEEIYADSADSLRALKQERERRERQRQEQQKARDGAGRDERLREHAEKERSTIEMLKAMAQQSRAQGLGMMRPPQ